MPGIRQRDNASPFRGIGNDDSTRVASFDSFQVSTRPSPRHRDDELAGRSPAFTRLLAEARAIAPLDVHVLLGGASGTGKNQIARFIHAASLRAGEPFVEVNCAALPEALIESELFGAAAGAHSTARVSRPGKLAMASGGTLFLDEIAELPLASQATLLQFLQSGEYWPLGAASPHRVDVRVLAASNVDLREAVAARHFRADLLYRLEVFPLHLPSLAERAEDIEELALLFIRRACARHRLPPVRLCAEAVSALAGAPWPGNVRQFEHAVEAGVIRAAMAGRFVMTTKELFPGGPAAARPQATGATFEEATKSFQAEFLKRRLDECGWNVSECARRLDLARSHLYTLIEQFQLSRDDRRDAH